MLPTNTGSSNDDSASVYRQEMRDFVIEISDRARVANPDFIVIPQNGNELITLDGEATGSVAQSYVDAIDGIGREDLYYGYEDDDEATPSEELEYMLGFLDRAEVNGVEVLVTDYCTTQANVDDSYEKSAARNYISFAADRDLASIPAYPVTPREVHSGDVTSLSEARNFLYVLDPWEFGSREAYLDVLRASDHDLLIIDAYVPNSADDESTILTASEVASLREKDRGGLRPVVAYMSIGEAEDYRPYWDEAWEQSPPEWLEGENPDWPGNYKVRYWTESWQEIISTYLDQILAAGFDGVYLDIIDAFEYYE